MNSSDSRQKLWAMIEKFRFTMLTSQHEGESLRSRPMTTIKRDYDGTLWFFAGTDSEVVRTLTTHDQVSLSYGNSDAADFVCVAGPAALVSDSAKKRELWNPGAQAWFPEGAESDSVVLIKVMPNHAEYWDSKSNKLVRLFSMAKAAATGTTPTDIEEHKSVEL